MKRLLLALLFPLLAAAQTAVTNGNTAVVGAITCKSMEAVRCVDAANTAQWAGTDVAAWINSALNDLPTSGGKVDATGLNGVTGYTVSTNPCAGITKSFTLVMPEALFTTNVPWVCTGAREHLIWPTTNNGITGGRSFPVFTITTAARASNVMTYTIGSQPFAAGTFVVIGGVTDITMDMPCVVSSPTSTTFSCSNVNNGSNASSSGGIVSQPILTVGQVSTSPPGSAQDLQVYNLFINAQAGATNLPTAYASQGTQELSTCFGCIFANNSRWAAIDFLNSTSFNGNHTFCEHCIVESGDNGNHRSSGFLFEAYNSRNGVGSQGTARNMLRDFTIVQISGGQSGSAGVELQSGVSAEISDGHIENVTDSIYSHGNNIFSVHHIRDLSNVTNDVHINIDSSLDPSVVLEDVGGASTNGVLNSFTGTALGAKYISLYTWTTTGVTNNGECYVVQGTSLVCTKGVTLTTPTFTGLTNGTGDQLFNTTTTCTTAGMISTPCTTAAITLPVAYSDTN